MTEATGTSVVFHGFLDFLKTVAWCKQEPDTLVAVHNCTPEIIVILADREAKLFPGGISVKINKSWLTALQEHYSEGNPIPLLLIWKKEYVEISYRRHKSWEFPYDSWVDPAAAAYEREIVRIPANQDTETFSQYYQSVLERASACPSAIPPV